jgi:hypothetical protein
MGSSPQRLKQLRSNKKQFGDFGQSEALSLSAEAFA